MKISLKWLNDYVEVKDYYSKPEELGDLLTSAGLEVEGIENQKEQLRGVVLGQVVELAKHPDADKLTLCQVDIGSGEPQQIVCGAKNHKQGDKVAVALPGAVLPGDFAIKKSKIRGVESGGMMCSEVELGLAETSDGIMILPEDAPVGQAFSEYSGLDDVVIELSVTPNRADCLSHFGLAREVACLLGRECHLPKIEIKETSGKAADLATVELNSNDLCPRYTGRGVVGVKIGPSPQWLKSRLESVGLNSINNVVDITNFVMMELGQPLHAFDADEIGGKKIIIDQSKENEKFTTLDGTEIKLTGHELMIRDADRPVALAGVVGGLNSGVTDKTTSLFVESAHFTPQTVRRASRKFGIDTDSAYRFSRGTDPEVVVTALNRACQLIQEIAGGVVTKDHLDEYPNPHVPPTIELREDILPERLGYPVELKDFEQWMKRLGCELKHNKKTKSYQVKTPAFRWDLEIEMDLVEEYARLHGYDKIPETMPALCDVPAEHDAKYINENRVVELLTTEGYLQAVNYNFISEKFQTEFLFGSSATEAQAKNFSQLGLEVSQAAIPIVNPLSEETGVMRTSLMPGLIKNLLHNYRHGLSTGRLFEVGHCFRKDNDSYKEFHNLGMVAWGQREGIWDKPESRPVVYDLKATLENMLQRLGSKSWQWRAIKSENALAFLHPGQSVGLFFEGKMLGYIGTLHPLLAQNYKLRHDCALAEFDLSSLMRGQPRSPKFKKISKYPAVEKRPAFLVPDSLAVVDVQKELKKLGGKLLQSVDVFDVYRGKNLPEAHSSVAFRLIYQDDSATLTEEQLTKLQKDLISGVEKKFSIQVR